MERRRGRGGEGEGFKNYLNADSLSPCLTPGTTSFRGDLSPWKKPRVTGRCQESFRLTRGVVRRWSFVKIGKLGVLEGLIVSIF